MPRSVSAPPKNSPRDVNYEDDNGKVHPHVSWRAWNAISVGAVLLALCYIVAGGGSRAPVAPVGSPLVHETPAPQTAPPSSKFVRPSVSNVRLPDSLLGGDIAPRQLKVVSWNVSPGLQNPFAHWPKAGLLPEVEQLLKATAPDAEAKVSSFFTQEMFGKLRETMATVGRVPPCFTSAWERFADLTYAAFLKAVREASHLRPLLVALDKATNPLVLRSETLFRPSALTCYDPKDAKPVGTVGEWWQAWLHFAFEVEAMHEGKVGTVHGVLSRSPQCPGLDMLLLGIYDAGAVHALAKARGDWEAVRRSACTALFSEAAVKTKIATLEKELQAHKADVAFLQGVGSSFLEHLRASNLGRAMFQVKVPLRFDHTAEDNAVVLLRTGRFIGASEVTQHAAPNAAPGTVLVISGTRVDSNTPSSASRLLLCSASTASPEPLLSGLLAHSLSELPDTPHLSEATTPRKVVCGVSGTSTLPELEGFMRADTGASLVVSRTHFQSVSSNTAGQLEQQALDSVYFYDYTAGSSAPPTAANPSPNPQVPTEHSPVVGVALDPVQASHEVLKEKFEYVMRVRRQLAPPPTPVPVPNTPAPQPPQVPPPPPNSAGQGEKPSSASESASGGASPVVPLKADELRNLTTVYENGTIDLPPAGVGAYMGVPEGVLLPPVALTDKQRITVTAVCDNGLGDRFGSLFSAVHLAYTLRARFHIVWNMNNECRARCSLLFDYDGTSSSVANNSMADNLETRFAGKGDDYDAIITLNHHFSTGHLVASKQTDCATPPPNDGQWLCGQSRLVTIETNSPLVRWAQDRIRRGLRTNILHHADRIVKGADLKQITEALQYYKFKISPAIMQRVERFTSLHQINPKNTVGIHLRGTDARVPLNMQDVITDVRIRFKSRTFFVASDDADKENEFIKVFAGRAVKNTMKLFFPEKMNKTLDFRVQGKLGAGRFNIERPEPAVIDALTDMAILSRTERPMIVGVLRDSSFGKMSTTLCVLRLSCDEEMAKLAEQVPAPARLGG